MAPAYDPKRGAPILVVEHSPQLRRVLSEILTGRGYGVRTAGTGPEALQIVKNVQPGLILLDMLLPSMDGWTVARELKAAKVDAPIIVMADATHALKLSYEVGGVEALGKPFAMEQLLAAAERHYRGRSK
jgi:two-component system OmpR family response regulator